MRKSEKRRRREERERERRHGLSEAMKGERESRDEEGLRG